MTKIDPVEFDADMDRAYIPVNSRYEIQTKGKGSSFRIANTMTHERWLITDEHLHPMLTELAYGTNAELIQAQSKIEMLEAKLDKARECLETIDSNQLSSRFDCQMYARQALQELDK